MTTLFWILAGAMLLAALAFLLPPLLRVRGGSAELRDRRDALERARRAGVLSEDEYVAKLTALGDAPTPAPRSRALSAALALLLPLSAIGIYFHVGEPRALDPIWQGAVAAAASAPGSTAPAAAPDMEQAVAGLAERLRGDPDDLEGWILLGRAYKAMERFEPAREAFANAHRLAADSPDVMVEYAEAQVLASDSRRFEGEARQLLDAAVAQQPDHQRGQWLLGIAHYQAEDFAAAAQVWETLLASLPEAAEPRQALVERIADARQRAGLAPLTPGAAATTAAAAETGASPTAPANGPRLTVTVDIAPALKARVGASDVLFVFARAAEGPRMPIAIQRLPAASLPVTVTLDDSTSMMPAMKLSTIPRVVVGARISRSGQATPQAGDLETLSDPIANTHAEPLSLLIERELQ